MEKPNRIPTRRRFDQHQLVWHSSYQNLKTTATGKFRVDFLEFGFHLRCISLRIKTNFFFTQTSNIASISFPWMEQPLVYSTTDIEIHVSMFPEARKKWKHAFLSFLADLQFDFDFVEQDVEYYQDYHRVGKLFAQYTKYVSLFLDLLITSSRPKTTEHLNSHTQKKTSPERFYEVSHLHITWFRTLSPI